MPGPAVFPKKIKHSRPSIAATGWKPYLLTRKRGEEDPAAGGGGAHIYLWANSIPRLVPSGGQRADPFLLTFHLLVILEQTRDDTSIFIFALFFFLSLFSSSWKEVTYLIFTFETNGTEKRGEIDPQLLLSGKWIGIDREWENLPSFGATPNPVRFSIGRNPSAPIECVHVCNKVTEKRVLLPPSLVNRFK